MNWLIKGCYFGIERIDLRIELSDWVVQLCLFIDRRLFKQIELGQQLWVILIQLIKCGLGYSKGFFNRFILPLSIQNRSFKFTNSIFKFFIFLFKRSNIIFTLFAQLRTLNFSLIDSSTFVSNESSLFIAMTFVHCRLRKIWWFRLCLRCRLDCQYFICTLSNLRRMWLFLFGLFHKWLTLNGWCVI